MEQSVNLAASGCRNGGSRKMAADMPEELRKALPDEEKLKELLSIILVIASLSHQAMSGTRPRSETGAPQSVRWTVKVTKTEKG